MTDWPRMIDIAEYVLLHEHKRKVDIGRLIVEVDCSEKQYKDDKVYLDTKISVCGCRYDADSLEFEALLNRAVLHDYRKDVTCLPRGISIIHLDYLANQVERCQKYYCNMLKEKMKDI